jgi:pSer/pThr/pTyr-binding forkhead associated (FHA) protein
VRTDGLPGAVYTLAEGDTVCGRLEGGVRLAEDDTISPRHARFTLGDGRLTVVDLASLNGTFVRLRGPHRLGPGDEFRIGRQLLRVEPMPRPAPGAARSWGTPDAAARWRLEQLLEGGGLGEVRPLREGVNLLGRDSGDLTFPADPYVSGRHARLEVAGDAITLADLGSSNGTFVRIAGAVPLAPGDQLLVGAQLLRVEA